MSANANPLWPIFDGFPGDLSARGAGVAIGHLAAALARQRERMPSDAWKASCADLDRHPALSQLLEDPYSRDARTKPAGYAGDARTLDYVYLRDPGPRVPTPSGRALFDVSTGVPIAAAVRDRCRTLADEIARRARCQPITVASIACGHARELDSLAVEARSHMHFWGLDQDARSIDYCRSRHGTSRAAFHVGSVRDIIAGRVRIPPSDLIYASGLFDYLDQRAGAVVLKRMIAAVNVGGTVIVPNLTPRNDEVGYMEAVMDWWMCYRTESDLSRLLESLREGPARLRSTTFSGSDGRIAWLRVDRVG